MGALQILALIVTGIALHILPITSEELVNIGQLPDCAAFDLRGDVFVKNEREVIIRNFYYDGRGAGAWFHAMRRGTTGGVYNSHDSYYYTLPGAHGSCDSLQRKFVGEEVRLTLPVSITDLVTIGILDYQHCNNFGYVDVPHDLDVPAAPADLPPENKGCPKPTFQQLCTPKGGEKPTAHGFHCRPVGEGPSGPLPERSTPSPGGTTVDSGTSEKGGRGRVRFGNLLPGLVFLVIDGALRVDGW